MSVSFLYPKVIITITESTSHCAPHNGTSSSTRWISTASNAAGIPIIITKNSDPCILWFKKGQNADFFAIINKFTFFCSINRNPASRQIPSIQFEKYVNRVHPELQIGFFILLSDRRYYCHAIT